MSHDFVAADATVSCIRLTTLGFPPSRASRNAGTLTMETICERHFFFILYLVAVKVEGKALSKPWKSPMAQNIKYATKQSAENVEQF